MSEKFPPRDVPEKLPPRDIEKISPRNNPWGKPGGKTEQEPEREERGKTSWRDQRNNDREGLNKPWRDTANDNPTKQNDSSKVAQLREGLTQVRKDPPNESNKIEKSQKDEDAIPRKKISDNWLSNVNKNTGATEEAGKPQPQKVGSRWSQNQQPPPEAKAPAPTVKAKKMATVLYNFDARTGEELTIAQGDMIEILEDEDTGQGWIKAREGEGGKGGGGVGREGRGRGKGRGY
jgi:hypothetical protein